MISKFDIPSKHKIIEPILISKVVKLNKKTIVKVFEELCNN